MNPHQRTLLNRLLLLVVLLLAVLIAVTAVRRHRAAQAQEAEAAQQAEGVITEQSAYTALSYYNGSATLSFAQDEEGSWLWADDPDFPLDDTTVLHIVDVLSYLKPQQTITEGDTLDAYGLDQPMATLSATAADGGTLTIALGDATTDGNSYYMLMNGDESTVYIISDILYDYMSQDIYSMCRLPEFPQLREDNMQSVVLQSGEALTALQAVRPETDGEEDQEEQERVAATWRSGGANVTDHEDVAVLFQQLSALSFSKCVDFKPSADAATICGFDTPVSISVTYVTEAGTEATMTLLLGTQTLDAAGYYARLNEDTTIYQIETAQVSDLLRIAQSGLAADTGAANSEP